MNPLSQRTFLAAATLAMALLAVPAGADWLVMHDGERVETDGEWTEKGKLVVFTDTLGNLVSLRLSEVDLAASRQATADAVAAANRPAPPPPPPQESVFRLTDADVGHIDVEEDFDAAEGEEGEGEEAAPTVVVIGWESDESSEDGLQIRATLENQGEDVAVGLAVAVTIFSDDGVALSTTAAQLTSTGLVPGQTTELVANFAGFFEFAAVNFDVGHRSLATRPTEEVPSVEDSFETEG